MNKTRIMVINAILIAILLVMSLVPFVGFIQVGPVTIILTHIPVIVGAIAFGPFSGAILGLTFGIGSWLAAIFRAATPVDLLFVNPLVAILPRVLFGLFVAYLWILLTKGSSKNRISKVSLVSFFGTLAHTLFVLVTLYVAMSLDPTNSFNAIVSTGIGWFLISTISMNALIESLLAVYFSVAILKAMNIIPRRKEKVEFIPKPMVQANQMVIVSSVLLSWGLGNVNFLLLPLVVGSLGFFFGENPVMILTRKLLTKPLNQYHPEDPEAQRFSQGIALIFLSIGYVASLLGWSVISNIALVLVLIAAVIALLGFCVGCFIFYQLSIYRQSRLKGK